MHFKKFGDLIFVADKLSEKVAKICPSKICTFTVYLEGSDISLLIIST